MYKRGAFNVPLCYFTVYTILMKLSEYLRILFCTTITAVLFGCSQSTNGHDVKTPIERNDGWAVSTPIAENMDESLLVQAVRKVKNTDKIDGFVVVKNGKLIAEVYSNGYDVDKPHKVWSITKSIVSGLVGIAIEHGFIGSERDSITMYMQVYSDIYPDDKKSITVEHLLAMTSGIEWQELGGEHSAGFRVAYSPDWVAFVLQQPMVSTPGSIYNYSSGNYMLFAPILMAATHMQADKLAEQYLLSQLGITNYQWMKGSEFWTKTAGGEMPGAIKPDPPIDYTKRFNGFPNLGSGLMMIPRDMAKIGQLYLNKGRWEGHQIIPQSWIEKSLDTHFGNTDYGYGWRLGEYKVDSEIVKCFYATGFGLQSIYVFPKYELIIVFTQQNYRTMPKGSKLTQDIIQNYVLKAVKRNHS